MNDEQPESNRAAGQVPRMLALGGVLAAGNIGFQLSEGISGTHIAQIADDSFSSAFAVSAILAINPLTNVLVSFPIGILSDYTWWMGGRRRPYLLIGTIIASLAMAGIPLAPSALLFVVLVFLYQAAHDVVGPAFEALMGDATHSSNRGRVIAVIAFGGYLAQFLVYDRIFQMSHQAACWSVAVIALFGIVLTVVYVREREPDRTTEPVSLKQALSAFRTLVCHRPLLWVTGITVTMSLSVGLLNSYFALWSTRQLMLTESAAGSAFAWRSVATMVFLVPFGFLTDLVGRRPWVILGMLFMAAGAAVGWFAADAAEIFWMGMCYGVGMGLYSPSFQGMMYDAIPRSQMGQAVVALMVVRYLAQVIVFALCGALIDWLTGAGDVKDYRVVFIGSCAFALLSASFTIFAGERSDGA